ncbi:MAG: hypothetical protein NTV54_10720 [Ignavibacteriales bacterium]|nr:hypothetical protein [Ignavibacteriales bacterium]
MESKRYATEPLDSLHSLGVTHREKEESTRLAELGEAGREFIIQLNGTALQPNKWIADYEDEDINTNTLCNPRLLKNSWMPVILSASAPLSTSSAKNPFVVFRSQRWILRRCATQNDNPRWFFRRLNP